MRLCTHPLAAAPARARETGEMFACLCLPWQPPGSLSLMHAHPCPRTCRPCRLHSIESDPLLSLISTRLATVRERSRVGAAHPGHLPAAVRQWEMRWEELTLVRPIGRGSFGKVYQAVWRGTPIACKLLVDVNGRANLDLELPASVMADLEAEAAVMARMR